MNILHICTSSGFSGREQYALAMAKGQRELGHTVWMATAPGSALDGVCRDVGVSTIGCNPSEIRSRYALLKTILQMIKSGLDAIHLHGTRDVGLVLLVPLLAKFTGHRKPVIIMQTHLWIDHRKRDLWHWILYRGVDEVWCSSRNAKENLHGILPVPQAAVRVVNYGLNIKEIEDSYLSREQARRALNLPADQKLIVCVSRLDRQKGVLDLLNAAIPILSGNQNLGLVFIGGPTVNENESLQYQEELNLRWQYLPKEIRERIYFVGPQPESYRLLKAFDLFVLPSYKECFSLALLEAQLAALPVLGTATGGTPEAICENQTGWLCPARNVPAMTTAIETALSQSENWPAIGGQGERWVKEHFDFQVVLANILELYSRPGLENHSPAVSQPLA